MNYSLLMPCCQKQPIKFFLKIKSLKSKCIYFKTRGKECFKYEYKCLKLYLLFASRLDRKKEAVNCNVIIYRFFLYHSGTGKKQSKIVLLQISWLSWTSETKHHCRTPSRLKFEMKMCLLEEIKTKWFNLMLNKYTAVAVSPV